jgi:Flp pilus assembly pilin Flp
MSMSELIKKLVYEEEGQDLVEYALLLVFLALAAITALPALGQAISNVFVRAKSTLESGS